MTLELSLTHAKQSFENVINYAGQRGDSAGSTVASHPQGLRFRFIVICTLHREMFTQMSPKGING